MMCGPAVAVKKSSVGKELAQWLTHPALRLAFSYKTL